MSIGVALVTCDRENFFNACLNSLINLPNETVDHLVVVNDHPDSKLEIPGQVDQYFHNSENMGVGKSKNIGLKALYDVGCEHIFLLEDDVVVSDPEVFNKYIHASESSGIKHLNFCLHGEDNKYKGKPAPKLVVEYRDFSLALYHNIYGALSYYHRDVIENVGLMDEQYYNAMEHVDHTMQIIQAGYHPPFRWFADIHNSHQLIAEQDRGHEKSKIRSNEEWKKRFVAGVKLFHEKFNINVCDPTEIHADKTQVIEFLKDIKPKP